MSRTRPALRIALPSEDSASSVSRDFLQERLRIFGGWNAVLAFAFLALRVVADRAMNPRFTWAWVVTDPGMAFHGLGALAGAALWGFARAPVAWSGRALRAADLIAAVAIGVSFTMMGVTLVDSGEAFVAQAGVALLTATLAVSFSMMWRAVAVPATPWRTAAVTTAAVLPLVAADVLILGRDGATAAARIGGTVFSAAWCVMAVVTSTVAAGVVFGLRREVRRVQRLGQYALEEKIGEGATGMVYRARHAMLRRPTAIKLLSPDRAGAADLERFEREVQLTATLTHPNTVAIYDYGRTPQGLFYYAMELLDGLDLEEMVRRFGPQPEARVIHILVQVCGALAEAHARGLLHRDIKPANIILTSRGGEADVAKVVDFGLVTWANPAAAGSSQARDQRAVLAGTPAYFSPEAIAAPDVVDARSDLYALGAVGYFLLTGTRVFEGSTIQELCRHHLHTNPTPPSARLGRVVDPTVERVVLACLAKRPEARPDSADALSAALGASAAAGGWTRDDARAWWARYRPETRAPSAFDPDAETIAVDLVAR